MKRQYSYAPSDYDRVAAIFREVGDQMLGRLEVVSLQPKRIVEVASATGYCTALLANRYPQAIVTAIDESPAMLEYAKAHCKAPVDWLCASLDALPLPDQSVDLLVSNLGLPWCRDSEKTIVEWARVLRPGGLLMISSLGVDTLRECPLAARSSWLSMDMHDMGDVLMRIGLVDPVMDVDYFELQYKEKEKLESELAILRFIQDEPIALSPDEKGVYSLSVEIFYAHAWGGIGKQYVAADGLTHIPLAHLRRQLRGGREGV